MNKFHDAYLIRLSGEDWGELEYFIREIMHEADKNGYEVGVFEQWVYSDINPDKEKPDWVTRDDELELETSVSRIARAVQS